MRHEWFKTWEMQWSEWKPEEKATDKPLSCVELCTGCVWEFWAKAHFFFLLCKTSKGVEINYSKEHKRLCQSQTLMVNDRNYSQVLLVEKSQLSYYKGRICSVQLCNSSRNYSSGGTAGKMQPTFYFLWSYHRSYNLPSIWKLNFFFTWDRCNWSGF